jgi:hypothetical protein
VFFAECRHLFDAKFQIFGAVVAAEFVAQVPVGCVKDSHGWLGF